MKATEHKSTGEKMQVYEIGYLLVPSVPEEKVTEEVSSLHEEIKKSEGEVISEDFPKLMELSYSMSKTLESKNQNYDSAYFGWVKFEIPVANLSKVEEYLKKSETLLRYLTIKTVRENTMFAERMPDIEKDAVDLSVKEEGSVAPKEEKKVELEDDIDKSIDALVIS